MKKSSPMAAAAARAAPAPAMNSMKAKKAAAQAPAMNAMKATFLRWRLPPPVQHKHQHQAVRAHRLGVAPHSRRLPGGCFGTGACRASSLVTSGPAERHERRLLDWRARQVLMTSGQIRPSARKEKPASRQYTLSTFPLGARDVEAYRCNSFITLRVCVIEFRL